MEHNSQSTEPLGKPAPTRTRDQLVDILREHPGGLTIAELARALGLKHNAVRKHLVALAALGSVAAERVSPTAVGRPPTRFRITGEDGSELADRTLSRLLLQALGNVDASEAERIAFNSNRTQSGATTLDDTLGSLGFAPADVTSASERDAGGRTIELRACPYVDLVGQPHGHLICAFHRGLIRRDMPAGASLQEFRIAPRGPRCRIVLTPANAQTGSLP
ncbi:MAG: helix-turn-helix domain-containing protein [Gaiellales bacterium]